MIRCLMFVLACLSLAVWPETRADVVTDWNSTIRSVMQHDGIHPVNKSNPGWATRSIAMMNGAIYDAFQAVDRTHAPFLVNTTALPNTSLEAAVHQAAYDLLTHCYPGEQSMIDADYNARMALIPDGIDKTNGMALGTAIAHVYKAARASDHADEIFPYTPGMLPGQWRPDPWNPSQSAWGPGWRNVSTFAIPNTADFVSALPPIPALNSQEYTDAFNQVKAYGDLNSTVRTPEQEEIGLFWAYDRPIMGPPPVLFLSSVSDIATQAGNSPEENARLFAMASMAQADAAIAAWDTKFVNNFWRPVAAIHEAGDGGPGDLDGNPDTIGDPTWRPLGAPGPDPGSYTDDFTPPFPAWTSGHATMGGAVYKAIELFFGTNVFDEIDGIIGNNTEYTLTSQEAGSGGTRAYSTFTQTGILDIGTENSPEGENGTSRIYLGLHWIFDQRDGISLGNSIAAYVSANYFKAVPEPGTFALGVCCAISVCAFRPKRKQFLFSRSSERILRN